MSLASRLNERVRIERPVGTGDGFGGQEVSWAELATVFAEVKPVFGAVSERMLGEQRQSHAGYRVTMRLRGDVSAAMRLNWRGRELLIHSVHEHEGTLNLLCYEENL